MSAPCLRIGTGWERIPRYKDAQWLDPDTRIGSWGVWLRGRMPRTALGAARFRYTVPVGKDWEELPRPTRCPARHWVTYTCAYTIRSMPHRGLVRSKPSRRSLWSTRSMRMPTPTLAACECNPAVNRDESVAHCENVDTAPSATAQQQQQHSEKRSGTPQET